MAFNFWRELASWIREQPVAAEFTVFQQNVPETGTFIAVIGYENTAPYGINSPIDRGLQIELFQIVVQHADEEVARATCEALRQAMNRELVTLDSCTIFSCPRGSCYRASWTTQFQYRCNMSADVPSAAYRH